jgi:hypothetical protein
VSGTPGATADGVQTMRCHTSIAQPYGYIRDANTTNDTLVAPVRVVKLSNLPFAELLSVKQDSVDGQRVVLDVQYRINPSVAYGVQARMRVCLTDPGGTNLSGKYALDSLMLIGVTFREGEHVRVGITWTDPAVDPPTLAVARAEVVPDLAAAKTTSCATGAQQPATQTANPNALVWAAREFRVGLGWASAVTLTKSKNLGLKGVGDPNIGRADTTPVTKKPKVPPTRTGHVRATKTVTDSTVTPPATEEVSDLPTSKPGTFVIKLPTGIVHGQASFICQETEGKMQIMISLGGEHGLLGAISGKVERIGTGSHEVSEDESLGFVIGIATVELPVVASYPANSGNVTISEWTRSLVRGSFRYSGSFDDMNGVARKHNVSGTFAATPIMNCQ